MQVLHIPDAEGPKEFSYDEEWLAILRSTHSLMSLQRTPVSLPGMLLSSSPVARHPSHADAVLPRQSRTLM